MKSKRQITILLALTALQAMLISTHAASGAPADTLATPESFAAVADTAARSAALFTEAGKVLAHPRCVNCHPAGDRPRQGDVKRLHQPPVARGEDGFGLPAMRCQTVTRRPISNRREYRAIRPGIWRRMRWPGRARHSRRSASRSKIRRATAAARSKTSCIMWAGILWSAGPGLREAIAHPRRARIRSLTLG